MNSYSKEFTLIRFDASATSGAWLLLEIFGLVFLQARMDKVRISVVVFVI